MPDAIEFESRQLLAASSPYHDSNVFTSFGYIS